jgi:hypothetical protein
VYLYSGGVVDKLSVTFGRLEALLSTYFRIDPDRAGTFRARIKQLQRLNFPSGVNVGRGARFEYEIEHLIKLTFAFELLAVGIPAKLATDIVEQGWPRIAVAVQLAVGDYWSTAVEEDVYCIFAPDLLSDSSELAQSVLVYEKKHFLEAATNDGFRPAAILAVNVTKLMRRLYVQCDQIRIEKFGVQLAIRQWETELPGLFDVCWIESWQEIDPARLKRFKPATDAAEDLPF